MPANTEEPLPRIIRNIALAEQQKGIWTGEIPEPMQRQNDVVNTRPAGCMQISISLFLVIRGFELVKGWKRKGREEKG